MAIDKAQVRTAATKVAQQLTGGALEQVPADKRGAVLSGTVDALAGGAVGAARAQVAGEVREALLAVWAEGTEVAHSASKQTKHSQLHAGEHRPMERADGTRAPMQVRLDGAALKDGVHSMRALLAVDAAGAEKILKSYHRHLKNAYPGKGEVEGPKTLESYLKNHPNWDITLEVKAGRIVFGANTQRFETKAGTVAVFEHMFAAKGHEATAQAAVQKLVEHHRQQGARLVLTELNDPRIMSAEQKAEDDKRPAARGDNIEFMKRFGFRAVDAPYGQPSFGAAGDEVTHLVAGVIVLDDKLLTDGKMSSALHAAAIGGFFSTFDNLIGKDVNADPTYAAIRKHVPDGGVALLPLDAERSFLRAGAGADWFTRAAT